MSQPGPSPAAAPRRFYELDSLRGVAALTVVFYHFAQISPPYTRRDWTKANLSFNFKKGASTK